MLFVTATNGAIRPAVDALLNQRITKTVRATVNSLQSLLMPVYIAVLHPATGAVADALDTSAVFALLAALCTLPAVLALPSRRLLAEAPDEPANAGR